MIIEPNPPAIDPPVWAPTLVRDDAVTPEPRVVAFSAFVPLIL